tara:strand:+ start:162 stop:770 length:609 start_codon:yes stop_codon:yes gene_type:complete
MTLKLNGSSSGSVSIDAPASTTGGADLAYTLPNATTGGVIRTTTTPGAILQVAQTLKTDGWSATVDSGAEAEITGLALAFTPTLATSKVLLTVHVSAVGYGNKWMMFNLKRDSTAIGIGDQHGSNRRRSTTGMFHNMGDTGMGGYDWTILDSPSTTSAIDYQVVLANASGSSGTFYCNQSNSGDYAYRGSFVSTITAMEVAA